MPSYCVNLYIPSITFKKYKHRETGITQQYKPFLKIYNVNMPRV